jgi:hypothetical protein
MIDKPMRWVGNFVSLPMNPVTGDPIVTENPHLIKCIAKDGNCCMCTCDDCVDSEGCKCEKCSCWHEAA